MSSMFHKPKSLPISHDATATIRRRIPSFDFQKQSISSTTAWSSKSVSSMAKTWWNRGCEWLLSRKPEDLEMNQEETAVLGCHNKGSWRHILYKFRSEIRKLVGADQPGLPQTIPSRSYSSAF